jgi:hypothetical protein
LKLFLLTIAIKSTPVNYNNYNKNKFLMIDNHICNELYLQANYGSSIAGQYKTSRGRDRMIVELTTTYAISAYPH